MPILDRRRSTFTSHGFTWVTFNPNDTALLILSEDANMAGESFDDDSYVANLLKQDAKSAAKKYELVGIDAFNPKRCVPLLHWLCAP